MRLLTALFLLLALLPGLAAAETLRVGTWKTAQTIQPFSTRSPARARP